MDEDEIKTFLRNNLTISINRDQDYYNYPYIEVKLKLCGEVIDSDQTTIYDAPHNG